MSNYREQTDYIFRKKARKAQDQPTELNIQEIDQTEEVSSIPVNETTNSNAGTQNTSVKPKKKPRQKSQVQHSQEIQAKMNTQTQPSQVTKNTDNTQTNQGAINIQKQVVVNNFNCNNTSLPVQPKNQNTNKSEAARKSQTLQTQPKQAPQTQIKRKHFDMKTLEFLRDQDIKIERQIETDLTEQDIKIERDVQTLSQIEEQASEIRQMVVEEKFEPELYQKRLCSELEDIIQNYAEDHANMKITKIQSNLMINEQLGNMLRMSHAHAPII
ncbi:Hypothetical_protein [Hexamita inflata]|uniref:Hypothetical_protein n=1 Tax=Hexamita inflata TaxID=28002 RepID=A0AA86TQW1_9EUKA|nr:Hypothetical protein HINF_LOCUS11042 [Hexamita inflata]